jgi:putative nucleotidyltransferase with HDIG domain
MDYVSVRISTLRGDQKINFNTYIKINDKMLLYLRKGDSFEGERLIRLKEKKLRKMYILNDEENSYRNYLQHNIEMAYDDKSEKDISVRAEVIQGAQQSNTEDVFENPDSVESYGNAKAAAQKYVEFLTNNAKASAAVLSIQNTDHNLAHHGVTVSALCVGLANRMGLKDPKKAQLLALGALLHDYGHHNSPIALNRPIKSFNKEEFVIYKKHPTTGAEKVQDKKHFDQVVNVIIKQHEEKIDGTGLLGLPESQQDPLAIIVSTANALDRLISFEGVPKAEAAKKLMIEAVGSHPLQQIQLLSEIMKEL